MPPAPRFSIPCRIYWEDTDAGGVVYYANYLKFMERCRTDWLRALAIDQLRLRAERQLQFVVVSVKVDFLRPAVLNDEVLVTAQLERLTGRAAEKGLTLIPLRLYFKRGRVKLELGLMRGKKMWDKRRTIAERDAKRDLERVAR